MPLVVTGATGHLGRLVVEALLDRGLPAAEIVAAGRNTDVLKDLGDRGVQIRRIEFDDPAGLREAFRGADRLLLVSGSELGQRTRQHQNAVDAARAAGVGQVVYTSALRAATTSLQLAAEHLATEQMLQVSGIPHVVLRNGWYTENYTDRLATTLQQGRLAGSAGDGRISAATRADFAAAAAAVLAGDGHDGAVYELGGDESFTLTELARTISEQSGQQIGYTELPVDAYVGVLVSAGIPEPLAALYADIDRGIAAGDLYVDTRELSGLIGRPTTPLADAVAAALA